MADSLSADPDDWRDRGHVAASCPGQIQGWHNSRAISTRVFTEDIKDPKERAKAIDIASRKIEDAFSSRLNRAAREAGLTLAKNVLRHTAITMRINATNDVAATSRWAGNSPAVLEEHYLGNALPEDAERFYQLRPTPRSESVSPPSDGLSTKHDGARNAAGQGNS